ncbi:MAG: hypothetical protein KGL20_06840, partial [Rhodospirillales bacterium]|nr:hypothetical protein [Rhodospirillales bacterium]
FLPRPIGVAPAGAPLDAERAVIIYLCWFAYQLACWWMATVFVAITLYFLEDASLFRLLKGWCSVSRMSR